MTTLLRSLKFPKSIDKILIIAYPNYIDGKSFERKEYITIMITERECHWLRTFLIKTVLEVHSGAYLGKFCENTYRMVYKYEYSSLRSTKWRILYSLLEWNRG